MKKLLSITLTLCLLLTLAAALAAPAAAEEGEGDWWVIYPAFYYIPDTEHDEYSLCGYEYTADGFHTIPTYAWNFEIPVLSVQTKNKIDLKQGVYLEVRIDEFTYSGEKKCFNLNIWNYIGFTPGATGQDYGSGVQGMIYPTDSPDKDDPTKPGSISAASWYTEQFTEAGSSEFAEAQNKTTADGKPILCLTLTWDGTTYALDINGAKAPQAVIDYMNAEWGGEDSQARLGFYTRAASKGDTAEITITKFGTSKETATTPKGTDSCEPYSPYPKLAPIADPSTVPVNKPAVFLNADNEGSDTGNAPTGYLGWGYTFNEDHSIHIEAERPSQSTGRFRVKYDVSYDIADFPVALAMMRNYCVCANRDGSCDLKESATYQIRVGDINLDTDSYTTEAIEISPRTYPVGDDTYLYFYADFSKLFDEPLKGRIHQIEMTVNDIDRKNYKANEFDLLFIAFFRSVEEAEAYAMEHILSYPGAYPFDDSSEKPTESESTEPTEVTEADTGSTESITESSTARETEAKAQDGCTSALGYGVSALIAVAAACVLLLLRKRKSKKCFSFALALCMLLPLAAGMTVPVSAAEGQWTVRGSAEEYREGFDGERRSLPGYEYTADGFHTIPSDAWRYTNPYISIQSKNKIDLKKGVYWEIRVDDFMFGGDNWLSLHIWDSVGFYINSSGYGEGVQTKIRGKSGEKISRIYWDSELELASELSYFTEEKNKTTEKGLPILCFTLTWDGTSYALDINGAECPPRIIEYMNEKWGGKDSMAYLGIDAHRYPEGTSAELTITKFGTSKETATTPTGDDSKAPTNEFIPIAEPADPDTVPLNQPALFLTGDRESSDTKNKVLDASFSIDRINEDGSVHVLVPPPNLSGIGALFMVKNQVTYKLEDFPVALTLTRNFCSCGYAGESCDALEQGYYHILPNEMTETAGIYLTDILEMSYDPYYIGKDSYLYFYCDFSKEFADFPDQFEDPLQERINGIQFSVRGIDQEIKGANEFDVMFTAFFRTIEEAEAFVEAYLTNLGWEEESEGITETTTEPTTESETIPYINVPVGTERPDETTRETESATEVKEQGGCVSAVGCGTIAIVTTIMGCCMVFRKKKE